MCRGQTQKGQLCKNPGPYNGYCHLHVNQDLDQDGDCGPVFFHEFTEYGGVPNFRPAYREPDINVQLHHRLQQAEMDVHRLREAYAQANSAMEVYRAQLQGANGACDDMESDNEILQRQNEELEKAAARLKERLQTALNDLHAARLQASSAQSALTAAVQKAQAAESARLKAEHDLDTMRVNVRPVPQSDVQPIAAEQSKLAVAHLEQKVNLLTQQLTAATAEFKTSQMALQSTNDQLAKQSKEASALREALSAEQDKIVKAGTALTQAERDMAKLTAENATLLEQATKPEESSLPTSQPAGNSHPTVKYYNNDVLDFGDCITTQFYDPGRCNLTTPSESQAAIPTLMGLRAKMDLLPNERETILVDWATDQELQSFQAEVDEALLPLRTVQERAQLLATMVSTRLGGPGTKDNKFSIKTSKHIDSFASAVISIGALKLGVCRHRSILFKVLADNLKPGSSVPTRLVRGRHKEALHCWNVVRIDHANGRPEFAVVDVMQKPGELIFDKGASSEGAAWIQYYNRINRNADGTTSLAGAALDSFQTIQADNRHGWLVDLALGEELGRGGFGTVHKAKTKQGGEYRTKDGKEVAIKTIRMDKPKEKDIRLFKKEMQISSQLNHPNIVRCLDFSDEDAGTLRIYMEYMPGGNLTALIESKPSYATKVYVAKQVAEGLLYLHTFNKEKAIVHLDLKPDNILLSKPEKGLPYMAKIVDFGISETIGKAGTKDALNCGAAGLTWAYASPEVMRQQTPTPKADVYSFGVIMWQLFSGKVPFSGGDKGSISDKVLADVREDMRQIPAEAADMPQLINACWQASPEGRPSMAEVVAWLKDLCRNIALPLN